MYPVTSEVKHMILAFESALDEEVIYAINMLTMFSVNTEAPFLFYQYPNMLDSLTSFMEKKYPPKYISDLEYIRNLTLAIRNLCINYKNLSPLMESPIMKIMMRMFEDREDRELVKNITEIFSSMTKVGWDCQRVVNMIEYYIEKDHMEDIETGIELIRSLI